MALKTILNQQTDFTGEFPVEWAKSGLWRMNESAPDENNNLLDSSGMGHRGVPPKVPGERRGQLQDEIMVVSDLIEKCIYENAHVALDQTEYQKRYDGLTTRFDTAKARLEEIEAALADKKSRRAAIDAFLDTLAQADPMEKFDPALWCGLIDYVTVYARDDVRFAFKDGQEIKA